MHKNISGNLILLCNTVTCVVVTYYKKSSGKHKNQVATYLWFLLHSTKHSQNSNPEHDRRQQRSVAPKSSSPVSKCAIYMILVPAHTQLDKTEQPVNGFWMISCFQKQDTVLHCSKEISCNADYLRFLVHGVLHCYALLPTFSVQHTCRRRLHSIGYSNSVKRYHRHGYGRHHRYPHKVLRTATRMLHLRVTKIWRLNVTPLCEKLTNTQNWF